MMSIKVSEVTVKRKFGERLRELRKSRSLSQEKLAFETGMDLTSINEIEMGRRSPTLVTICKIAKALKVNGGQLLPF
ncbi:MAG: hypothetical protein UU67_C0049G0011 [Candidatus Daviesbacteria bacterium GW2011_GWB1_41_5]|uniref:HTH cro/C1-type domain-containing protein n=1 Tax=Candidatus Daviesbacteria bacterium GW2011_GWB1_41_5 TaxID=1618429 RepID=A0A0G0WKI4_9BACT|nr:MAG: hypothetical protein UU67_C0049G0011 [Candidatus Daviesbacteria bacterium GW2011_GWB1_41_5]